jgi:hypothetical protein
MEIVYLPSTNPENAILQKNLVGFKKITKEEIPDTPICKFTFMISISKVLNNETEALMIKLNTVIALLQIKMIGSNIFISNFCSVKKGSGQILLNQVIALAKHMNADIVLSADEFGDNPKSLMSYYQQFGFVNTTGNTMVRSKDK